MKKPLAVAVATLALTLSLGLAACGSDDSDDATLSNSELIAQADEICGTYNDKLDTLTADAGLDATTKQEEVVAFISDEIVPLYQDQVEELRALKPNEDDAEAYNDLVDTLESELQAVEDDPAEAMSKSDPFAGASAKAEELGLKVCGAN